VSGILSRIYRVLDGDVTRRLRVTWNAPVEEADETWFCEVELDEEGKPVRRARTGGVDAVQALYLALCMVAARLHTDERYVFWFEPDDDLGLPTARAIDDLVAARAERFAARRESP
jgi:hypothetical protein